MKYLDLIINVGLFRWMLILDSVVLLLSCDSISINKNSDNRVSSQDCEGCLKVQYSWSAELNRVKDDGPWFNTIVDVKLSSLPTDPIRLTLKDQSVSEEDLKVHPGKYVDDIKQCDFRSNINVNFSIVSKNKVKIYKKDIKEVDLSSDCIVIRKVESSTNTVKVDRVVSISDDLVVSLWKNGTIAFVTFSNSENKSDSLFLTRDTGLFDVDDTKKTLTIHEVLDLSQYNKINIAFSY